RGAGPDVGHAGGGGVVLRPDLGQDDHAAAGPVEHAVQVLRLVEEERRVVPAAVEPAHQVEQPGERAAYVTGLAVLDEEDALRHRDAQYRQSARRRANGRGATSTRRALRVAEHLLQVAHREWLAEEAREP